MPYNTEIRNCAQRPLSELFAGTDNRCILCGAELIPGFTPTRPTTVHGINCLVCQKCPTAQKPVVVDESQMQIDKAEYEEFLKFKEFKSRMKAE
jgi:hypothetical protein